jgi:hypothetical protein
LEHYRFVRIASLDASNLPTVSVVPGPADGVQISSLGSSGLYTVVVQLDSFATEPVTVSYSANGSAPQTLTISPLRQFATIPVALSPGQNQVVLSNPQNAQLGNSTFSVTAS